jgi:hypothetical protein
MRAARRVRPEAGVNKGQHLSEFPSPQGEIVVGGSSGARADPTDLFLSLNGLTLEVQEEDVIRFMLDVAQDQHPVEQIADWIRARLRKR